MDQKKQSGKAVHYDGRYLDEHLKYKDILQQKGRYSNEVYRFAEYCKYICLVLLTIGLLFLLLSWAASIFFKRELQVIARAPGPQISNAAQRDIDDAVGGNSSAINQTVNIFESRDIDGKNVMTGYQYDPPFDDGLGEYDETWCYTEYNVNGQTRSVYFLRRTGAVPYNEVDRDLLTRGQFNRLKSGCGVQ